MSFVGIDIGTSGIRVGAFDARGSLLAEASRSTLLSTPGPGLVETDAEGCLADVVALLGQLASSDEVKADPAEALSFSVQGEAVVPVDSEGRALAPAPVSMDRRGAAVLDKIVMAVGASSVQRITGQPVHPMFSIYKVAAEGEGWDLPGLIGFRCLGDFVAVRLGARPVIDTTMAARTGAFDVEQRAWSAPMLDSAGLTPGQLPEVALPGTPIGHLSREASNATGLPSGLPIIVGSHDQASSFWGGGGQAGSSSVYALGSSDCLTVGSVGRPSSLEGTGLATYAVAENRWLTLAGTAAGGWALEWFARTVGATSDQARDELLAAASSEPAPLLVLPYLAGSGTLDNDPQACGAIIGLTLETTRPQLTRGFLESAGFELRKIAQAFRTRHIAVGEIWAVGGGAGSKTSLAVRASAAGVPLTAIAGAASLRGAAMQAAVGVGQHPTLDDVPRPAVAHVASPDPRTAQWYEAQGARYAELYHALIPLNPHTIKETS